MSDSISIAVVGMGDMGSAVAKSLGAAGLSVYTCLEGRSAASKNLARQASVQDTESLADLVRCGDIFLSILPPAAAPAFANEICQLIREHSPDTVFVDCNAISPDTVRHIATIAGDNNVRFQDVGIVGAAPRDDRMPVRFYSSGPWNDEVRQLATAHIEVCEVGEDTGRASAIKMVYASVTNATHSLRAAAAIAAERLGISEELHAEWQHSLPGTYESMQQRFPRLAADADRWAGEMHEIAQTYRSVGLTPAFHEGAAWMFEALAATALGEESRHEAIGHSRSMHEVVEIWSETISVDV